MVKGEHKQIKKKEGLHEFKLYQYQTCAHYFEFEYPDSWSVKNLSGFFSQDYECIAIWVYGPWNKRNTCSTGLSISVIPLDGENSPYSSAEECLERWVKLFQAVAGELKEMLGEDLAESFLTRNQVLSRGKVDVAGLSAREVVIAEEVRKSALRYAGKYELQEGERAIKRYVAFEKGPYIYQLSYWAPEDEDSKYVEAYKLLLSTFRISSSA